MKGPDKSRKGGKPRKKRTNTQHNLHSNRKRLTRIKKK
jgi:hypothetical protein